MWPIVQLWFISANILIQGKVAVLQNFPDY